VTIGITVCTYNRPEYAEKCIKSVRKHLSTVIDHLVVVNDGSDAKHNGAYGRVEKATRSMGGTYIGMDRNQGVAATKNIGLRWLLEKGCDWLFTLEDDILVRSPKAVTEYVRIAEQGVTGLSFAHHGEANFSGPVETVGDVEYYFHSIGAWCLFRRDELTKCGLLDERFNCAWEHVEHSLRLGVEPYRYPDVAGSADWLQEQPNSIEKSSIRPRPDWQQNIRDGLRYWSAEKPDTFKSLFGEGQPLHQYAASILG
jgi:GT2 family glycosyltransferase